MTHDTDHATKADEPSVSRRQLLARLGLAVTAIYAAPALLELTPARASGFSGRGSGRRRRSFSNRGGGRRRRSFS